MNRPNLFIAGAMKCGTTILNDFLAQHPDIAVAPSKEVHYFTLNYDKGDDWYLQQFPQDRPAKFTVDASPTYMDTCNTRLIPSLIKKFSPAAKIIMLIRDPVERLISHFNHQLKVVKQPAFQNCTLPDALTVDLAAAALCADERSAALSSLLNYSAYYRKIQIFIAEFGLENVLVIHNDDLRSNGQGVMEHIFDFLGLPHIQSDLFSKQRYLGGTKREQITLSQELRLYALFGRDYYRSCIVKARRYSPPKDRPPPVPAAGAIVDDVAIGHEGWLFLVRGSNNVLEFFSRPPAYSRSLANTWAGLVLNRAERLRKMNINYLHMFIPEKLTIHGDRLPWRIDRKRSPGSVYAAIDRSDVRDCSVDIFNLFNECRDKSALYFKTDSHWTAAGAFLAYQALCTKLKIAPRNELLQRLRRTGSIVMDLGGKLIEPVREEATFFQFVSEAKLVEANALVAFKRANGRENDGGLHVGSCVRYENPQAPVKKRVLLFGDSFSEYREHLLSGLLAETFSEFAFIWSTNLDFGFIETYRPDIVISAMTERFMTQVPKDDFDVQAFAAEQVARATARPATAQ